MHRFVYISKLFFSSFKMALNPKQSGEFIVKNAKYLEVQELGVKNLAKQVSGEFEILIFSNLRCCNLDR